MNRLGTWILPIASGTIALLLVFGSMPSDVKGDNPPSSPAKSVPELVKQVTRGIGRVDPILREVKFVGAVRAE